MKKYIITALLLSVISCYIAPDVTAGNGIIFQAPTMNIEGTAGSIVSRLDKSLQLTATQKPRMLHIITGYLKQKVNIQSLQHSNATAYKTKLNSMQNGLHAKLKPLLTLTQYTEFMAQQPKSYDETNVLSQLYY
ncbi:hypothetical protein [Chitinophaga nivalis]|uniref:Uncharacterized protein n=1 Tax=Chitinophaga nivalis TaxID=2991709 RepID=A0ABT3ISX1_9BACT|nr:hypothetical protein [Chitinophaga nivalis]MCW3463261.1 hypothetical protein [Chitinophaga nivalis]MCW3487049.1 hypothetical protein [Chitinophaga nivalis]